MSQSKEVIHDVRDERFNPLIVKIAEYLAENYELEFEWQGKKIRVRFVRKSS
ncbi:MAG: hypothetical protein NDF55_10455 [archaeon GB-1867-005]|nr:hypothetical protein [Candidatus Culexmicrobium cathedralense]